MRIKPQAPNTKHSVALDAAEAIGGMVKRGTRTTGTALKRPAKKQPIKSKVVKEVPGKKPTEKIEKKNYPKKSTTSASKVVKDEPIIKNKTYTTASGVKVTDKRAR